MTLSSIAPTASSGHFLLGKHRVEALSDGLFAIVMTLLVLELKVPEISHHPSNSELLHALLPMWRVLFSFVLTFILASIFWLAQQTILTATRTLDRLGAVLHLTAMMFVAFMPFSTAMLGHFISSGVAMGLYFGNQFLVALMLCLAWFRERRARNLVEISAETEQRVSLRVVSMTCVLLGACIAGSLNPQYAFLGTLPVLLGVRIYRRRMNLG